MWLCLSVAGSLKEAANDSRVAAGSIFGLILTMMLVANAKIELGTSSMESQNHA
jgi:hypothetical protein